MLLLEGGLVMLQLVKGLGVLRRAADLVTTLLASAANQPGEQHPSCSNHNCCSLPPWLQVSVGQRPSVPRQLQLHPSRRLPRGCGCPSGTHLSDCRHTLGWRSR